MSCKLCFVDSGCSNKKSVHFGRRIMSLASTFLANDLCQHETAMKYDEVRNGNFWQSVRIVFNAFSLFFKGSSFRFCPMRKLE